MLNQTNMHNNRMISGDKSMKLSDLERKKLIDAFAKMFRALTYQNLLNGQTLGASWFNAIRQMESYISAKNKYNPAVREFGEILAAYKKRIAKQSMTHKNKDKGIKPTPDVRAKLQQRVISELNAGKSVIGTMILKYQPIADAVRSDMEKLEAEKAKQKIAMGKSTTPKDTTTQLNAMSLEKIKLQILKQMRGNTRAA